MKNPERAFFLAKIMAPNKEQEGVWLLESSIIGVGEPSLAYETLDDVLRSINLNRRPLMHEDNHPGGFSQEDINTIFEVNARLRAGN